MPKSKTWCFTLEDYNTEDESAISSALEFSKIISHATLGKGVSPLDGSNLLLGYVELFTARGGEYMSSKVLARVEWYPASGRLGGPVKSTEDREDCINYARGKKDFHEWTTKKSYIHVEQKERSKV